MRTFRNRRVRPVAAIDLNRQGRAAARLNTRYRRRLGLLITTQWIPVPINGVLMRIPEIGLRFVRRHLLPLPLNDGAPFGFLISAGGFSGFATSQNDGGPEQRD